MTAFATSVGTQAAVPSNTFSDSLMYARTDSLTKVHNDSVWLTDSVGVIGAHSGYVLMMPPQPEAIERSGNTVGESWVILSLMVVFVMVCLRVKSNARYLMALVRDMTEVRDRSNLFDETVRETSMLVMLNVLWSGSMGILLYGGLLLMASTDNDTYSFGLTALQRVPTECVGVCAAVCGMYTLFMTVVLSIVGNVFSDRLHTSSWLKGFLAQQGLSSILLFPLALLFMFYPNWSATLLALAAVVFAAGKIIFICKGFRIFFTQISSWVLFLYYLCSLEIVPLIIAFAGAMQLCSIL